MFVQPKILKQPVQKSFPNQKNSPEFVIHFDNLPAVSGAGIARST